MFDAKQHVPPRGHKHQSSKSAGKAKHAPRKPEKFKHIKLVSRDGARSMHIVAEQQEEYRPPTAQELAEYWKSERCDATNFIFDDDAPSEVDDEDDPDVKPQEYMNYVNENNAAFWREDVKDGESILDKIDKVDKSLVCRMKVDELYKVLLNTPMTNCTRRGVRMIINESDLGMSQD